MFVGIGGRSSKTRVTVFIVLDWKDKSLDLLFQIFNSFPTMSIRPDPFLTMCFRFFFVPPRALKKRRLLAAHRGLPQVGSKMVQLAIADIVKIVQ